SGLRKTNVRSNSLAHRTTWLRSDLLFMPRSNGCSTSYLLIRSSTSIRSPPLYEGDSTYAFLRN
ncbi:hypothetical protein PTB13_03850, partial [Bacillus sp. MHSD17]|nr:hypothetical protein [Bacillus sp. MHSD17]